MTLRVVIMGVSGCGKSSLKQALSARLGHPYREGDDLHPPENVARMRAGQPLGDIDRLPWLDRVSATLRAEAPVLVGCSALKHAYRDRLRAGAGGPVTFLHLHGSRELIAARMAERKGHYMPLALLDSQFATLESPGPDEAITLDLALPLPKLVDLALGRLA